MSHEIVKSIAINDDKVYLTSASNNVRPLTFSRWECTSFSQILAEKGREALYAKIGEEVWNGNLELRQGSKLCKLYLEARSAFPSSMNWDTFEGKAAGEFLGKMVASLEANPAADLSKYVKEAFILRNDKNYILEAAHRTGHNFLNSASKDLQNDRAFALEVLRAGNGAAWFKYPAQFKDDKEFALEGLKLNGCFYRELGDTVKADREVILEAFRESPDKKYHEHLPDIIPGAALFSFEKDPLRPSLDKKFIMDLLEACPSMHMSRAPYLLTDRDIALKWAKVGKFFPHSVKELPKQYLKDKEFQDVLVKRFEGTDLYDVLQKRFAEQGVQLRKTPLSEKISSAENRQKSPSLNTPAKEAERD